ncbi:14497_t:CDS:2, partial [Entrophospora sp. SA101]
MDINYQIEWLLPNNGGDDVFDSVGGRSSNNRDVSGDKIGRPPSKFK